MMLDDLATLTKIRSDDITQHVYELLKHCNKNDLREFLNRVTDMQLKEELNLAYSKQTGRHTVKVDNKRFSLEKLVTG
jgi:hypothetical protein